MNKLAALLLLICLSTPAVADIWKWVDAKGDVHFVNSRKPIYTWLDDYGRAQYADKPGHESAVSVDLVWHSTGDSVEEAEKKAEMKASGSGWAHPGESPEERLERENAEQYYCKRARDIYDSYLNAPRLYETNEKGEKVYLTEEQTAAKIKETEAAVAQICQ
jgi:hypothetical protein